jgi:hypothetical protein
MSCPDFYFTVYKHNRETGKNRCRSFPEDEYLRACSHYFSLTVNGKIDRAKLYLCCGRTGPIDQVALKEHWK